jgi:hypothetical protein
LPASRRQIYGEVFDGVWYLADNPDVAVSGMDPLAHYLATGWREGRDPSPLFDVSWYLGAHSEVSQNQIEPLEHYLEWGWREGWDPHPLFDSRWYTTRYGVSTCPLVDYLTHGIGEGRLVHPDHRAAVLAIDTRPVSRQEQPIRWGTIHQPERDRIRTPLSLVPWLDFQSLTIDYSALKPSPADRRAERRRFILGDSWSGEEGPSDVASEIDRDVLEIISIRTAAKRQTYLVAAHDDGEVASMLSRAGLLPGGSLLIVDEAGTSRPGSIQVSEREASPQVGGTVVVPDPPRRAGGWASLQEELAVSARSAIGAHQSANLMITRAIEAAYDSALLPTALVAAAVEEADATGLRSVHYMSREGWFLARLHEIVAPILSARPTPPRAIHLALSRRSTFGPTLGSYTVETLLDMWRQYQSQTLRAMIVSLGDDVDHYRQAAKRHRLTVDEIIGDMRHDRRVESFLADHEVQKRLTMCNRARRQALDAYLTRTWDVGEGRIVVVDVGWRGTIQDNLARGFPEVFFAGWYLALFPFFNPQPANVSKTAVGPDGNLGHSYGFMQPPAAVERPWTPDVPSTVDYRLDPELGAVPVEERELLGRTERSLIEVFQEASADAARIVSNWIVAEGLRTQDLQPMVRSEIARYYDDPPPGVADIWFSSAHDDTFGALNVTPFAKVIPSRSWLASGLGYRFRYHLDAAAAESRWSPGYRSWLPVQALIHLERALRTRSYVGRESLDLR